MEEIYFTNMAFSNSKLNVNVNFLFFFFCLHISVHHCFSTIQACYTGQRAEKIPSGLVRVIGSDCLGLDLSYNELVTVSAVKDFELLQELILDNNQLSDLKTLPRMITLTTLSLNNNKVNFIYAANNLYRSY